MKDDMNVHEYELLTKTWKGAKGAAYNATYEFCHQRGWVVPRGFNYRPADDDFQFTVTQKGYEAVKAYQSQINHERIDCV